MFPHNIVVSIMLLFSTMALCQHPETSVNEVLGPADSTKDGSDSVNEQEVGAPATEVDGAVSEVIHSETMTTANSTPAEPQGDGETGTVTTEVPQTADNSSVLASNDASNSTVLVSCKPRIDEYPLAVKLVNATGLLALLETEVNVTSRRSPAQCLAVLFYASWCQFSCLAAPHFNALPRAFPDIKVAAIDSVKHYSLNTQFGVVGVPTILLFHNGRPTARFNESEYNLKTFAQFMTKYTGLEPQGLLNVTSADFAGPVSSVAERETDNWLILSWAFIIICGLYFLVQSSLWRSLVESMKNIWREADEVRHQHAD